MSSYKTNAGETEIRKTEDGLGGSGSGSGGITEINLDTTPIQTIAGGTGISVVNNGVGGHAIFNTGLLSLNSDSTGAQTLTGGVGVTVSDNGTGGHTLTNTGLTSLTSFTSFGIKGTSQAIDIYFRVGFANNPNLGDITGFNFTAGAVIRPCDVNGAQTGGDIYTIVGGPYTNILSATFVQSGSTDMTPFGYACPIYIVNNGQAATVYDGGIVDPLNAGDTISIFGITTTGDIEMIEFPPSDVEAIGQILDTVIGIIQEIVIVDPIVLEPKPPKIVIDPPKPTVPSKPLKIKNNSSVPLVINTRTGDQVLGKLPAGGDAVVEQIGTNTTAATYGYTYTTELLPQQLFTNIGGSKMSSPHANSILPSQNLIDYSPYSASNSLVTTQPSQPFPAMDSSPVLTMTPGVSGYYKITCNVPAKNLSTGRNTIQIIANTGNPTNFVQSCIGYGTALNMICSNFAYAFFVLEAGKAYTFDVGSACNNVLGQYFQGHINDGTSDAGGAVSIWSEQLVNELFTSNALGSSTAAITSGTFTGFTGTGWPFSFTITPTLSGTHKVYLSCRAGLAPTGIMALRVFNSAGGGVLLNESWGAGSCSGNVNYGLFAMSTYTLTAGVSYTFQLQGKRISGTGNLVLNPLGNTNMICEHSPNMVSTSNFSTAVTTVAPTVYTLVAGMTYNFSPSYSGVYKISANVPLQNVTLGSNVVSCKLYCSSGSQFDILENSEAVLGCVNLTNMMQTTVVRALVLMQAGTTVTIGFQVLSLPAGNVTIDATNVPFNINIEEAFYSGLVSINGDTTAQQTIVGGTGATVSTMNGTTTVSATGTGGTVTSVSSTAPSFLTDTVTNPTTTPAIALTYSGTPIQIPAGNTGTIENTINNSDTGASYELGYSALAGTSQIEIVAGSTGGGNRGVIRTASAAGLDLNAQGSGKSLRLMTNSVTRATVDDTGVSFAVPLPVASGGLGVGTLTSHGVLVGTGTSAVVATATGTSGQALLSGGASANPSYGALDISTAAVTGTLAVNKGGSGVATLGAHGVLIGEGTSAIVATGAGTTGQALISGGASADPSFGSLDISTSAVTGTLPVTKGGTGAATFSSGALIASGTSTFTTNPVSISVSGTSIVQRDGAGNVSAANVLLQGQNPSSTNFGSGITIVGNSALELYEYSGTPTGTVTLTLDNTFVFNQCIRIMNNTGVAITVNANDASLIVVINASGNSDGYRFQANSNSPAGAGNWRYNFIGRVAPVPNGGTGLTSLTNHGILLGQGTSTVVGVSPGTTGQAFISGGVGADPAYGNLGVSAGGTGATTLTNHGVLLGAGTGAIVATAVGTSGQALLSGGVSAPAYGALDISTAAVTGTLGVANGGTGDVTLTAHGVLIGEGTSAIAVTGAGTTGQAFVSGGASADPSFATLGVAGGGTGATTLTAHGVVIGEGTSAMVATTAGTTGQALISGGASADPSFGALNISTAAVTGTLGVTNGGTGNSSSLTAGNLVVANGTSAFTAPVTYGTANAASTIVQRDAAGNVVAANVLLSGQNPSNTNFGAGITIVGTSALELYEYSGTPTGTVTLTLDNTFVFNQCIRIMNNTGVAITVNANDASLIVVINASGNSDGYRFQANSNSPAGSGNWRYNFIGRVIPVPNGGTGDVTLTNHGVMIGQGTSAVAVTAAGTSGQALLSGGASADPSFGLLGVANGGTGKTVFLIHGVVIGNNVGPLSNSAVGASGQAFISNGGASDPAFGNLDISTSAVTGTLGVANGGTGAATLTSHGVLLGAGTGAIVATAVGTSGQALLSGGVSAPAYGALDISTAAVTGTLPVTGGGTGLATLTSGQALIGAGAGNVTFMAINTAASANTLVQRDASSTITARTVFETINTTVSTALTLTSASIPYQILTGASPVITLPPTNTYGSTLTAHITIYHNGSGIATIKDSASTTIITLIVGQAANFVQLTSGSPGTWIIDSTIQSVGIVSVQGGGTGAATLTSGNLVVANGTSAFTAPVTYGTASAASTIIQRDSNQNATIQRVVPTLTTQSTTATLTISSGGYYRCANSAPINLTLPNLGALPTGWNVYIYNAGTSSVQILDSSAANVCFLVNTNDYVDLYTDGTSWILRDVSLVPSTQAFFATSSGTYTLPTNPTPRYIKVSMIGPGGGGESQSGGTGGTTSATTFGGAIAALGQTNGAAPLNNTTLGGLLIANITGGQSSHIGGALQSSGVMGCASYYGAGGSGGAGGPTGVSGNAAAAYGAGGGGGGGSTTQTSGGAGGSGGYIEFLLHNPAATYAYSVDAGGAGGTGITNGGAGGPGYIQVTEYYK